MMSVSLLSVLGGLALPSSLHRVRPPGLQHVLLHGSVQCHDPSLALAPARVVARTRTPMALAAGRKASAASQASIESFGDLLDGNLRLLDNLLAMGCDTPFESQKLAWTPLCDSTRDVAIVSEAGSGKTLAYLVPLVARLLAAGTAGERLFVVVPTHELAAQVCQVARNLCDGTTLTAAVAEAVALPRGAERANIVVGTPSRCAKLLCGGSKKGRASGGGDESTRPLTVVFDEADFMLSGVRMKGGKSRGVENPAANILKTLRRSSKPRKASSPAGGRGASTPLPRVVFVSATVPGQGSSSIGSYLDAHFPDLVWVRSLGAHRPVATLSSEFMRVADRSERDDALVRLCERADADAERALVFANSAARADDALRVLRRAGLSHARAFHPNVAPAEREAALGRFSKSANGLLVCSGLAARGIDLPDVALVIEYQLAPNLVEHMHRVGRTARAGKQGHAVSLYSQERESEVALVAEVERCREGGWKFL